MTTAVLTLKKQYLALTPQQRTEFLAEIFAKSDEKNAENIALAKEIDGAWADYQKNGGQTLEKVFAKYGVAD